MVSVEEIRKAQRADGPATVLAIGTATPANCVLQSDYPDFYFRITNSEHKVELKEKFKRMCEKSMIRKRLHAPERGDTKRESEDLRVRGAVIGRETRTWLSWRYRS
ncbi:unnamed protein product [Rhodiola kirilowii]